MEIIKKESIRFSDRELCCFEMAMTLMEAIENCASNPELTKAAANAWNYMSNVYDYIEEDE